MVRGEDLRGRAICFASTDRARDVEVALRVYTPCTCGGGGRRDLGGKGEPGNERLRGVGEHVGGRTLRDCQRELQKL